MNIHTLYKIAFSLILSSTLSVALNTAMAVPTNPALNISQAPMSSSASPVLPNIMVMVDNSGSMKDSVTLPASTIADMPSNFTYVCSTSITPTGVATASTSNPPTINMVVSSDGIPQFCQSDIVTTSTCIAWDKKGACKTKTTTTSTDPCGKQVSISNSSLCFDNSLYYNVKYYNGSSLAGGPFLGLNLNWYFSKQPFSTGSLTAQGQTTTRILMAKSATKDLIDYLKPKTTGDKPTVRVGLSTYGKLLNSIGDLDETQATSIKTSVDALGTPNDTPLATTLLGIGNYFSQGEPSSNSLTLHPNLSGTVTTCDIGTSTLKFPQNKCTAKVSDVFGDYWGSSLALSTSGVPTITTVTPNITPTTPPITSYCQKNAVILVSDGLPNGDMNISRYLSNYSGVCKQDSSGVWSVCNPTRNGSWNLPGFTGVANPTSLTANGTACSKDGNWGNLYCKNATKAGRKYETGGTEYLSNVANALYEMDLRPTCNWATGCTGTTIKPTGYISNIKTYAIGIADSAIDWNNSALRDAADKGGGSFQFAADTQALAATLKKMVEDFTRGIGSFSGLAANAAQLGTNTALFQAKYDTADWTGDLIALPLSASEDTNHNGKLDTGEDTNGNSKLDTGGIVQKPVWNAGAKIPAYLSRNIFTYSVDKTKTNNNETVTAFYNQTASTICNTLSTNQKAALGISSCTLTNTTADEGLWRLDWLRGDISHEKPVTSTSNINAYTKEGATDPRSANSNALFRNRARFYNENTVKAPNIQGDTAVHVSGDLMKPEGWVAGGKDAWLLGDIVDSDIIYVGAENYGYASKSGLDSSNNGETKTYAAFVTQKASRREMVYVGANDGFLHGFDARNRKKGDSDYAEAGKEILAYLPNTVFNKNGNLINLSSSSYSHQFFVNGSPKAGDAFFASDSKWHTVVLGTTGAGGKGIFALDVTSPSTFSTSNVLWEINTDGGPNLSDVTTDSNNTGTPDVVTRGFANNLGYTLPQPSINRMNNGKWAAIVANGYASVNNIGVLYVLNIETGAIIAQFDTKTVSSGLSTPIAIDADSNGTIDAIYAGDLLGNMWKFDVSSSDVKKWKIAYTTSAGNPAPLFTACYDVGNSAGCDATRQAITNKPQVGKVGSNQSPNDPTKSVMVYFGTGKYFENSDNTNTTALTQTFYGIWDKCPLVSVTTGTHSCLATTDSASGISAGVHKTTLQAQSILYQTTTPSTTYTNIRVSSNSSVDYTTQNGWYMDFINPNTSKNDGERIVSASLLRGGRIIFATLVPLPPKTDTNNACTVNTASISWLMGLDAITGSRLSTPALDIRGNDGVKSDDVVTVTINGESITAPPSAIQPANGSTETPLIIENPGSSSKACVNSSDANDPNCGDITDPLSSNKGAGRQSWRQLSN